jgi:hypothetical protein
MLTDAGAELLAVAVLLRFNVADLNIEGVPVYSLIDFETTKYENRDSCPLCKADVPLEIVRF